MVSSLGVQPTSAAFCRAHELHYQSKAKDIGGALRHNNFGYYNFKYRKDAHGPCTASLSKWPAGWTEFWFYHKSPKMVMCPLRISFGLPQPMMSSSSRENIQARVTFETVAAHITTRSLVEEYVAVRRIPCGADFSVPKGPGVVAPSGLVTLPFQFKTLGRFKTPSEEWRKCVERLACEIIGTFVLKEEKEIRAHFGDRKPWRLNRIFDLFKVPYPDYEEFEEGETTVGRNKPGRKRKVEEDEKEGEEANDGEEEPGKEQEEGGAEGDDEGESSKAQLASSHKKKKKKRCKIGASRRKAPASPAPEDDHTPSGRANKMHVDSPPPEDRSVPEAHLNLEVVPPVTESIAVESAVGEKLRQMPMLEHRLVQLQNLVVYLTLLLAGCLQAL